MARPSDHYAEPLRPTAAAKIAIDKNADKQMISFEKSTVKVVEGKVCYEGEEDEVEEKPDLEEEREESGEVEERENRRLSQDGLRPDPQRAKREQRRNGQRGQGQAGEEEEEEEVGRTAKKNTKVYRPTQDEVDQHERVHCQFQP